MFGGGEIQVFERERAGHELHVTVVQAGNTVAPCASSTSVCGRRRRLTSRLEPTRRI